MLALRWSFGLLFALAAVPAVAQEFPQIELGGLFVQDVVEVVQEIPVARPEPKPDEPAKEATEEEVPVIEARRGEAPVSDEVRLHLMEDSVVSGVLSVESITVTTEFGVLEIPVTNIVSVIPGLDSHPEQKRKIVSLIQQLGSNNVKERDEAQKALSELGGSIMPILEKYTSDDDAERRTRVQKIIAEIEEAAEEFAEEGTEVKALIPQDTVQTTLFTVVGQVSPKSFEVKTKFGNLTVALADIREARRDMGAPQEIRKAFGVSGANLVQVNYKNSGIRVNKGDEVSMVADGTIVMSPWGNNVQSTPDGGANFQWYIPNKIPGGALVGRIGTSGQEFKVGTKHSFTATKSGVLYFAVAMNSQFANQGYSFPGEYNVKVRVTAK